MKTLPWTGVYPAVTTKFTPTGDLDMDAFLYGVHAQVKAGADGIIIGGSLGESSTITHDERIAMLSATLEHVGHKVPVLVNIAEGSTRQAITLAQRPIRKSLIFLQISHPAPDCQSWCITIRLITR